jgi:16S rRNA G527 N7-methylase RsmG
MSNPEVHFVGIDSVKKKTVAVNEMIGELGIKNAEVVWSRIEEIDVRLLSRSTAGQ